jgi:hypothetical protein
LRAKSLIFRNSRPANALREWLGFELCNINYLRSIAKRDMNNPSPPPGEQEDNPHQLRFHLPYAHLSSIFGDGWFALKAHDGLAQASTRT